MWERHPGLSRSGPGNSLMGKLKGQMRMAVALTAVDSGDGQGSSCLAGAQSTPPVPWCSERDGCLPSSAWEQNHILLVAGWQGGRVAGIQSNEAVYWRTGDSCVHLLECLHRPQRHEWHQVIAGYRPATDVGVLGLHLLRCHRVWPTLTEHGLCG